MKIDWDISRPAKPRNGVWLKLKQLLGSKPVPLHMSNHYRKADFDTTKPKLF